MNSVRGPNTVKTLIWSGLAPKTRKGYQTGVRSYIYWAAYVGATAWPATAVLLEEWAANRIMGSAIARQGQVQPDTVASYLSAIRSWHVDHEYSLTPFETLRMKLLLQGRKITFSSHQGHPFANYKRHPTCPHRTHPNNICKKNGGIHKLIGRTMRDTTQLYSYSGPF